MDQLEDNPLFKSKNDVTEINQWLAYPVSTLNGRFQLCKSQQPIHRVNKLIWGIRVCSHERFRATFFWLKNCRTAVRRRKEWIESSVKNSFSFYHNLPENNNKNTFSSLNVNCIYKQRSCIRFGHLSRNESEIFLLYATDWSSAETNLYLVRPAVWPDLAIFCTLGNHSKPVATIIIPKSSTLFGNFVMLLGKFSMF